MSNNLAEALNEEGFDETSEITITLSHWYMETITSEYDYKQSKQVPCNKQEKRGETLTFSINNEGAKLSIGYSEQRWPKDKLLSFLKRCVNAMERPT